MRTLEDPRPVRCTPGKVCERSDSLEAGCGAGVASDALTQANYLGCRDWTQTCSSEAPNGKP